MSLANLNYYEIFSVPVSFQVSEVDLDREYKKLQTMYHPDRFSGAEAGQRLQALQQASLVNDAYETLKSPLKRAAYLLKLAQVDPEEHNQAHLQEDFLLQQLELREALEDLIDSDDMDGLDTMKAKVSGEKNTALDEFEAAWSAGELDQAKIIYNKLQFLFKLLAEINTAEEKLLDY